MSEFELIDKRREPSGLLRIRYGSGIDDPLPFILTVTPSYAAHADAKVLRLWFTVSAIHLSGVAGRRNRPVPKGCARLRKPGFWFGATCNVARRNLFYKSLAPRDRTARVASPSSNRRWQASGLSCCWRSLPT
jgi:hypothetical protein